MARRSEKRKRTIRAGDAESKGAPSSRRQRRSSGEKKSASESQRAPTPTPPTETDEERARREEIFEIMRKETDLPSVYAILEVARDNFPESKRSSLPSSDRTLLEQAEVAVSYLMLKSLVDHISRPLSFGGMALSDAKANEVAKSIFSSIGPAACLDSISESKIIQNSGLSRSEARKMMSHLKQVGEETRSELDTMRERIK